MKKEIINLNSHFWLPYNSVSSSFVYKFRDEVALWLPAKFRLFAIEGKLLAFRK